MALADWPEWALVAQERFARAARRSRAVPVRWRRLRALQMPELALRPVERAKAQDVLVQRSARRSPLVPGDLMWMRRLAPGPAEMLWVEFQQVQMEQAAVRRQRLP